MKENLISDKSLIYQWYFNDNMSVVDNPRAKATVFGNPTYNNGIATFNGSTDYYKLKTLINLGTKYSIEVKFKLNNLNNCIVIGKNTSVNYVLYFDTSINRCYSRANTIVYFNTQFNLNWNTICIVRNGISTKIYLNGIEQSVFGSQNANDNMIITSIGASETGSDRFNGQLEYIKIWNRQLSASEVKNNVAGKTYRALPYKSTTLFHINSDNGVIRDLTGKTTPVATNVQLPKIGSNINVMKFNGSSGNINIGSQALVGNVTVMGWINNTNKGEGNLGHIINNIQFVFYISNFADNYFVFSRNNSINSTASAGNSLKLCNSRFICITSTSTGITNIYIGDKNNPPTLSRAANQNAGTPVAGGTCYLGSRAGVNRTLNGWLNDIRCEQSILTLEEITQYWSNTKYKYQ